MSDYNLTHRIKFPRFSISKFSQAIISIITLKQTMTRKIASSVSVNDLDVKSHNYNYKDCVPINKKNLKILFRGCPLPEWFHRGS